MSAPGQQLPLQDADDGPEHERVGEEEGQTVGQLHPGGRVTGGQVESNNGLDLVAVREVVGRGEDDEEEAWVRGSDGQAAWRRWRRWWR